MSMQARLFQSVLATGRVYPELASELTVAWAWWTDGHPTKPGQLKKPLLVFSFSHCLWFFTYTEHQGARGHALTDGRSCRVLSERKDPKVRNSLWKGEAFSRMELRKPMPIAWRVCDSDVPCSLPVRTRKQRRLSRHENGNGQDYRIGSLWGGGG